MGIKKISVADALFSKVQQRVLGLLFSQPDLDFYTNEIIRRTGSGRGAVQRELQRLTAAGILIIKSIGNQKRYCANQNIPFFGELRSIVLKTFGLVDVLRHALKPLANKIRVAFIYGSVAKQEDTATSDIDLMLIGDDITYADIFGLLEKAEIQLGRKINPTFYNAADWIKQGRKQNNFI